MTQPARPGILVVTGASGTGKTVAVRALEERARPQLRCYYFDSIGVPSAEVMRRDFGGGEGWQADATHRWIERLASETAPGAVSVLDGQTRPSFVRAAAGEFPRAIVRIVLVECTPEVRLARLAMRGQSDLATPRMEAWVAYLRGQADALGLPILDSSGHDIEEVADALEAEIEALREETL